MKKIYALAGIFILAALAVRAQCTHTVDSDDFSNPSAWTSTGAGLVTVSNGACTFNAAADAVYDRIYRPLASTISDTYFKAEFNFTIGANPSGHGCGTNLLALSAGTLDPISYDASQSYALTNQDGLIVLLNSISTTDSNINDWLLEVYSKDGATGNLCTNTISLSSSILTYYVVFERTSATSTTLSMYSDAAHTNLLGQAVNAIPATITGLNVLQHGVNTGGWNTREFTGTLDDVMICDNTAEMATCSRIVDSDDFSNPAAWTATGAGLVTVSNGACTFNGAADDVYDRVYRPLASTISDTYFKAEFKFTIDANPSGHGCGTNLLALSAGTLDPISYDASQSYAATNQDGLIIQLNTNSTSDNNINNWFVGLYTKDGTTGNLASNAVPLSSSILTYYVVFERTSATSTTLKLYSDAAHTNSLGQAVNIIPASITGLNVLQHGVTTWGWSSRQFTGTVDDVTICDDLPDAIANEGTGSGMTMYPNPSSDGHVTIDFAGHSPGKIAVYDVAGKLVQEPAVISGASKAEIMLPSGFYLVVLEENGSRYVFRQVVE